MKILIADDSEIFRNILMGILLSMGVPNNDSISQSSSGTDALLQIKHRPPDLVITDFNMPGANGIHVAKYAKQMNPNVMIIIVSEASSRDLRAMIRKEQLTNVEVIPKIGWKNEWLTAEIELMQIVPTPTV
jgi:CheY-like chemotaxis protein